MWAGPTPQRRPEPFQHIDADLAETVPVVIPGGFARSMADGVEWASPLG